MSMRYKHQDVVSIKVYFPKCSPYSHVSSGASSWAQMVGAGNGVLYGGRGQRGPKGARIEKEKQAAVLHLDSHSLRGGTLREIFARIKCRSLHKKISLLKENSTYGNTELLDRSIFSSYRKQPTNKVTKNRQLYAEQPKTS